MCPAEGGDPSGRNRLGGFLLANKPFDCHVSGVGYSPRVLTCHGRGRRSMRFPQTGLWADVRELYYHFEEGLKSPGPDVYQHEMPGGQFTNLRQQARKLGLDERWPEVCEAYAAANRRSRRSTFATCEPKTPR